MFEKVLNTTFIVATLTNCHCKTKADSNLPSPTSLNSNCTKKKEYPLAPVKGPADISFTQAKKIIRYDVSSRHSL